MNKKEIIKICEKNGLKKIEIEDGWGETYYTPNEASAIINKVNVASNLVEVKGNTLWFYFKRGKNGVPHGKAHLNLGDVDSLDFDIDYTNPL